MAERLVDVLNDKDTVLHTSPVAVGASVSKPSDTDFEDKALSAAAHAQLVPTAELGSLATRMNVSRGGAMKHYGDSHHVWMACRSPRRDGHGPAPSRMPTHRAPSSRDASLRRRSRLGCKKP